MEGGSRGGGERKLDDIALSEQRKTNTNGEQNIHCRNIILNCMLRNVYEQLVVAARDKQPSNYFWFVLIFELCYKLLLTLTRKILLLFWLAPLI